MNIIAHLRQRFQACERGSLGAAFGFALMPIMAAIGISIDYSAATNARARLDSILDAAALAAVSPQVVGSGLGVDDQKKAGAKVAETEFNARLGMSESLQGLVKSKSFTAASDGGSVTIRICYEAELNTSFMRLLQVNSIPFGRCAQASAQAPLYVDVYVIVDASSSMGIGATTADQILMQEKLGCAFVCHAQNWEQPTYAPNCDTYNGRSQTPNCAKRIGAKLRFDVVKESLITLIDRAKLSSTLPSQFRFSISKFSNDLTVVQSLSSDLDRVKSSVKNMTTDPSGGTNMRYSFSRFSQIVPKSGDGNSSASPKSIVILMTDAVEDETYMFCTTTITSNGLECKSFAVEVADVNFTVNTPNFLDKEKYRIQLTDYTICNQLKAKAKDLITLNIEYLIPPPIKNKDGTYYIDPRFERITSVIGLQNIKNSMTLCASSPDLAFYASTPGDINLAMNKIYNALGKSATLRE